MRVYFRTDQSSFWQTHDNLIVIPSITPHIINHRTGHHQQHFYLLFIAAISLKQKTKNHWCCCCANFFFHLCMNYLYENVRMAQSKPLCDFCVWLECFANGVKLQTFTSSVCLNYLVSCRKNGQMRSFNKLRRGAVVLFALRGRLFLQGGCVRDMDWS